MDKLTSILALADDGLVAVDKAARLARQFDARLELVPTEALLMRHATERRPDLVIKAATGAHPLRRGTLGPTDRWLLSECPVPVLLAGDRPWNGSLRLAAAVDFADCDRARFACAILRSAVLLALGGGARLDVLYSEREATDERLRMERAVKLAQLAREFHIAGERLQRFEGEPDQTLPRIIEARQYDVLVIGAWFETLSSKLATDTCGDLLLVKPDERAVRDGVAMTSRREQRPYLSEQFL